MFTFKKKKKSEAPAEQPQQSQVNQPTEEQPVADKVQPETQKPEAIKEDTPKEKAGFFSRFKRKKKETPSEETAPTAEFTDKPATEEQPNASQPQAEIPAQEPVLPTVEQAQQNIETTQTQKTETNPEPKPDTKAEQVPLQQEAKEKKPGRWSKFKQGLGKTRHQFSAGLGRLFLGKKTIDEDLYEDIESQLLCADLGVETTQYVIEQLTAQAKRKHLKDPAILYTHLKNILAELLAPCQRPFELPQSASPFMILMVGMNGAGKTTTIGKLAKKFRADGKRIMMAAGDTFRAAAAEQLQAWGERNQVQVVAQTSGSDSAAVIYEGVKAAHEARVDVLLADTAGRLHTKGNLMEELKKVKRVAGKLDEKAPQETWLVLDASVGQNALIQAKEFHKAVGVTGIILTKLDGTAKGGVIFAIAEQLKLPILFLGLGEGIEDLRPFEAEAFIDALFDAEGNSAQ